MRGEAKVNITLDNEQKVVQTVIDAFQNELTRRIQSIFPSVMCHRKKGVMTDVELMGIDTESDRERLDSILQEIWEDENWRSSWYFNHLALKKYKKNINMTKYYKLMYKESVITCYYVCIG